jgi:hypothetical protein
MISARMQDTSFGISPNSAMCSDAPSHAMVNRRKPVVPLAVKESADACSHHGFAPGCASRRIVTRTRWSLDDRTH